MSRFGYADVAMELQPLSGPGALFSGWVNPVKHWAFQDSHKAAVVFATCCILDAKFKGTCIYVYVGTMSI